MRSNSFIVEANRSLILSSEFPHVDFLSFCLKDFCGRPLSWFQNEMWLWALSDLRSCVAVVHRGGAKSTTAEAIWCFLAALGRTKYCLYVSATKDLASDHVKSIRRMLENSSVGAVFPEMVVSSRTQYGMLEGWSGDKLVVSSGVVVVYG